MAGRIFLDAASGQPWSAAAVAALLPAAEIGWAQPQGFHSEAAQGRALRNAAVADLAAAWQVDPASITPVHGLSNAFKLAMADPTKSVAVPAGARVGMQQAADEGLQAVPWPVTATGSLQLPAPATEVLCIQAGNPETGVIHDLAAVRAAAPSALVVADATEWAGREPGLPTADVVVLRASSWGGPASVCFVLSNQPSRLHPRRRLSIAPDPVLLAVAAAAWQALGDIAARAALHREWLADFSRELQRLPGCTVYGEAEPRLAHLLSFTIDGYDGEALAHELDHRGFAVGAGSACGVDQVSPSAVLAAMGARNTASVRIGLPLTARPTDLPQLIAALTQIVAAA